MNALNKKTVDDINVKGQKVLVRCDFNVPLKNGVITDENRIIAALPTIKKLIADGGKVILCSHLGKPKGEPKPELSLAPVAKRLSELLGKEVVFAADANVVGENAKDNDIVVNVTKSKKLTNMRASGADEKAKIVPPVVFSLEEALEYIKGDEYVEVTPNHLRLRKIILDELERKRANKQ